MKEKKVCLDFKLQSGSVCTVASFLPTVTRINLWNLNIPLSLFSPTRMLNLVSVIVIK